jgi:GR25 family glycosyltransferase involved in LPS biosynthesis
MSNLIAFLSRLRFLPCRAYIIVFLALQRLIENFRLERRVNNTFLFPNVSFPPLDLRGLDMCDIVYINLEQRTDRRIHIENELRSLGIFNARRIAAVKAERGALGCAQSHLLAYNCHTLSDDRMLMVCEDDISFVSRRNVIDAVINDFYLDARLDVLLISYVAFNGVKISGSLSVTSNVQTAACYIVKKRALPFLAASAQRSVDLLSRGFPDKVAAIDVVWKPLQSWLWFAISSKIHAVQIESYSDIQNRVTNYFRGFH